MAKPTRMLQGTTLAWTERYGAALTARDQALEVGRDLAFAITLAVMAAGAVGFVAHAPSTDRVARSASASRSL
jgi:hypothetical protein